jgi:PAS domain S-box-containing protein
VTLESDPFRQLDSVIEQLQALRRAASFPSEHYKPLDEALAALARVQSETPAHEAPGTFDHYEPTFKTLVENAPDMIARLDRNQRYLYVNARVEEVTGRTAKEFIGKSNHELGLPESFIARWEQEMASVLETGKQGRFQFEVKPPFGELYYDVRLAPEIDRLGAVHSVLAIVRDVTEQEQSRRKLARQANRLRFLNEVSRAMRAAYSAEEVAEAALPFAQQLLGCPRASVALYDKSAGEALLLAVNADRQTMLGKGQRLPLEWNWLIDELEQGRITTLEDLSLYASPLEVLATLREEGVQSMLNVPLIVQDKLIGSLNLGMATLESMTDERVEIAREIADLLAIAIYQADLHQKVQRHAEALEQSVARRTEALRASEARFRTILESAAIGIALVDMEGKVISTNPALEKMLGYDAAELKGMNISQFVHPEDSHAGDALFREMIEGQRDHYRVERRYIRKDGTTLWVRPTVSMVRKTQNRSPYAIKLVDDITEEKKMREALIQAEKLAIAGQLGASLAHEISNPLQSVIGSLGLAAEMLPPNDEVSVFIEIAIEELERAAEIVAQLRDISRKSSPKERQPVQLNELVEKVIVLNKKRCENQKVTIEWEPQADLPTIQIVPNRMRQVFLNLLINAVEAMPQGGLLRIRTARTTEPDGLCVIFADNGIGIEPNLLPHLFEPFRSNRPEGLGLGLHISKTIVDEHQGRIEVDSKIGKGTTFTVWLPLQEKDEEETTGDQHG